MMDILEPTSHTVGAGPLFRAMADEIQLVTLINGMVRWDARQSAVSPGKRILVLILDVLAGKTPLYRLWERLTTTGMEILVGAGRGARRTSPTIAWGGPDVGNGSLGQHLAIRRWGL